MLTVPEFYSTFLENEERIRGVISWKVRKYLKHTAKYGFLDEILEDITLTTAEKIARGDLELTGADDVSKYLVTAGWWSYQRKLKQFENCKLISDYDIQLEDHKKLVYEDDEEKKTAEQQSHWLYEEIFDYVFSKYSFKEAAIFKCYIINKYTATNEHKFTYEKLEEMSGYSKTYVCSIVKKIRTDLQKNRKDLNPFKK